MTLTEGTTSGTILIVDDEPAVRLVVARLLQEWQFETVEAENGVVALNVAKNLPAALSMVITDLCMPYMDGYEFAHAFRLRYPQVPILFMTGTCPTALVGNLLTEETLLFKPFDPDSFLDTVARLLESHINQ